MRKMRGKLIVFILSVILGILISLNSDFNSIKKYFSLNTQEYSSIVLEKNDLYKKIDSLQKSNENINELIENYKKEDNNSEEVIALMQEQNEFYDLLTGASEVEGEGILVKISDGDIHNKNNNNVEIANKIFHDRDVQLVINELRKAGAEAIMINNYRVTPNSGLSCNGPFIIFESEYTEYAPFNFYAIGNAEEMEAAILAETSHIKELQLRELQIEIVKLDNIKMPATLYVNQSNYMKEFGENNKK